ncbi:hypothetical protein [Caulobacter sp. X]|uniref:hypothetical protein n=1 Tax=Caulobacter sp. X TaxID=2048901 RepID=UPI000C147339|nr:hypothetical protein [Caulobacter sp. X]PIC01296.1 hypothetical protein CSW60_07195 [Caulobacter sp. X]
MRSLTASIIAMIMTVAPAQASGGFYAQQATPIWDQIANAPGKSIRIVSPDGRSAATATFIDTEDFLVRIATEGQVGSGSIDIGPGIGSEMLWSPDSKAFFVTTSDDGANGLYRTIVVSGGPDGPKAKDVSGLVRQAFGHPVTCDYREQPNIAGITWLGPRRLLVAAQIINHSNCDSMGTFRAYEVDWRGMRLGRSFDQIAAKRAFGDALGPELKQASDECIRTPQSCWVSTNHPPRDVKPPSASARRRVNTSPAH